MKRTRVISIGTFLVLLCFSDGQTQPSDFPGDIIDTSGVISQQDIDAAQKVVQLSSVLRFFPAHNPAAWPVQQADRWCWSATADLIMSSFGHTSWKQCIQADDAFPGKETPRTCCDNPESTLCNRTGWPRFELYNFNSFSSLTPPTWDQIKDEIDRERPIATAVKFFDPMRPGVSRGGHMGTVAGYAELDGGEQAVLTIDPDGFHVGMWVLYEELYGETSDTTRHWKTYYEIYPYP